MQLRHDPVALILTRQALPTIDRAKYASTEGVHRGAYVLADAEDRKPQVLLLATGSEVALALEAYEKLKASGIKARVVKHALVGDLRALLSRSSRVPRTGAAEIGQRRGSRSRRPLPSAGRAMSEAAVRVSGSRRSGPRRRSRNCRKNSASSPSNIVVAARQQIEKAR
jgi:transketolase